MPIVIESEPEGNSFSGVGEYSEQGNESPREVESEERRAKELLRVHGLEGTEELDHIFQGYRVVLIQFMLHC